MTYFIDNLYVFLPLTAVAIFMAVTGYVSIEDNFRNH